MSKSPEDDTASQATERGKTSQVKRSEKQMEAKSRWKKERERQHKGVREGEIGSPTHRRKRNTIPPDNKSNMGTIKGYQVI